MSTPSAADRPTPPNRMTRRRARNRERLVAAATELMSSGGPSALTVTAVAERADLGAGTFYNYFDSREAIVAAVVNDAVESLGRRLDALTRDMDDAAEIFGFSLRHLVATAVGDPLWGWLLVRLGLTQEELASTLGPRAERDLAKGVASGRFAIPDLGVATAMTFGALLGTLHAHLRDESTEDPGPVFAEYMLRAVGLSPDEAHDVSRRPLPPLPSLEEASASGS